MNEFSALLQLVITGVFVSLIVLTISINISHIFKRLLAVIGYVADPD